jgi:hypothetical protein
MACPVHTHTLSGTNTKTIKIFTQKVDVSSDRMTPNEYNTHFGQLGSIPCLCVTFSLEPDFSAAFYEDDMSSFPY